MPGGFAIAESKNENKYSVYQKYCKSLDYDWEYFFGWAGSGVSSHTETCLDMEGCLFWFGGMARSEIVHNECYIMTWCIEVQMTNQRMTANDCQSHCRIPWSSVSLEGIKVLDFLHLYSHQWKKTLVSWFWLGDTQARLDFPSGFLVGLEDMGRLKIVWDIRIFDPKLNKSVFPQFDTHNFKL